MEHDRFSVCSGLRFNCGPCLPERDIRNQKVRKPAGRNREPDKSDAKARRKEQRNREANREIHEIRDEERTHLAESAKYAVRRHFNSHEKKEIAEPFHVFSGHSICEFRSVFSEKQRGNACMQAFNDQKRQQSKTCIQQQCGTIPFPNPLRLLGTEVLGDKGRNRIADGNKNQRKDILDPHGSRIPCERLGSEGIHNRLYNHHPDGDGGLLEYRRDRNPQHGP